MRKKYVAKKVFGLSKEKMGFEWNKNLKKSIAQVYPEKRGIGVLFQKCE